MPCQGCMKPNHKCPGSNDCNAYYIRFAIVKLKRHKKNVFHLPNENAPFHNCAQLCKWTVCTITLSLCLYSSLTAYYVSFANCFVFLSPSQKNQQTFSWRLFICFCVCVWVFSSFCEIRSCLRQIRRRTKLVFVLLFLQCYPMVFTSVLLHSFCRFVFFPFTIFQTGHLTTVNSSNVDSVLSLCMRLCLTIVSFYSITSVVMIRSMIIMFLLNLTQPTRKISRNIKTKDFEKKEHMLHSPKTFPFSSDISIYFLNALLPGISLDGSLVLFLCLCVCECVSRSLTESVCFLLILPFPFWFSVSLVKIYNVDFVSSSQRIISQIFNYIFLPYFRLLWNSLCAS